MNEKLPVVALFRHTILPPSETFIALQASRYTRYEPVFFGREAGSGRFDLCERRLIQPEGEKRLAARIAYTLTGRSGRLLDDLRDASPAIIHAHFGVDGAYALRFAEALGVPLAITFHGFDATRSYGSLLNEGKVAWWRYVLTMNRLKTRGALFVAISRFIRGRLVERGFPEERTVALPIGVDMDRLVPAGDEGDGKTVLAVGRLVEVKGFIYLLRAMAIVKERAPGARLVIVGDGPLRNLLQERAYKLGVGKDVEFRGLLSQVETLDEMRKAALVCVPSVTMEDGYAEGLGMVPLEAAALGRPAVGTDSGGIPEAIADGETGFVVEERSPEALGENIALLLNDPDRAREMGAAARRMAEKKFDARKRTAELEALYDGLITEKKIASGAGASR